MTAGTDPVPFLLPPGSEADRPPESRGLARDEVRLLVGRPGRVMHRVFRDLPEVLEAGDLLVVNTSATVPAALDVIRARGSRAVLHVSGELDDGDWVVEVRRPDNQGPVTDVVVAEVLRLPGGGSLTVRAPYPDRTRVVSRLWRAAASVRLPRLEYLSAFGRPIHYAYVDGRWPLSDLQTVYADTPGSAEMPSAGRPFTRALLERLQARGVTVASLVLHTGVSSPEAHEPPMPERFAVPEVTARLVTGAHAAGHRVIAVGTTVVRALETAVQADGRRVLPAAGWTDLVLGPNRPARVIDGLVTGLHPPEASHLQLLEAVVGGGVVDAAYRTATSRGYLWHEFGDSMLLLPG
ncbi:MAG: S-adenosylmethionine:tRNA ribosyltransferase-isomerase [Nocardioidaceae bacterium]